MRKQLAAAGLAAAGLAGGAVAGAALGVPGLVAAQEDTTTTAPDTDPGVADAGPGRFEEGLRDALAPLVADGTIDEGQLDAVVERLQEAGAQRRGEHGPRHRGAHMALDAAAEALGVTEAELREALWDGRSIADVAEANGVDLQAVIDALVADASARLDQAVESGRLTEAEAAEKKAALPERIADLVERSRPEGPPEPPAGDDGATD